MANVTITGVPNYDARGPSIRVRRSLSDKDALSLVDSYYAEDQRDLAKHAFERQWFLNVAFFLGYQQLRFSGALANLHVNPLPTWKRRYIANRLLPAVMRQTSKLTSAPITWKVPPQTPDVADQQASKVAESFLTAKQAALGVDTARWEMVLWQVITGTGFATAEWAPWAAGVKKVYLDPVTGGEIPEERLTPEVRDLLEQEGWVKDEPQGDIRVRAVSPFEIFVPILSCGLDLDSAPWIIHHDQVHLSELFNRYSGAKVKQVTPDKDLGLSNYFRRRLKTLVAFFGYFTAIEDRHTDEMATIRTLWIPPSREWPQGRKVVCTRSVVLENVPHPFADQGVRFPFVKCDYAPMAGRFFSRGLVDDLIHAQSEMNRTSTTSHNIRDMMGQPKWSAEKGSGISPITNEAGQIVWRNRGFQPPIPLTPVTDHQLHELVRRNLEDDFNTIAAQQEVTQAKVPPGVRSGVAIRLLQERDEGVIAPAVQSQARALSLLGSLVLKIAQRNYDSPRLVALHGSYRSQDVTYFTGKDLRENTQAVVPTEALFPKSPAGQLEKVLNAVQAGVLDPQNPEEKELILRAIDTEHAEALFTEMEADRRRAEIENDLFRSEDPGAAVPQVQPFDNHRVHLSVHNRFRKSDAYELLPPAQKQLIDAHCDVHGQFLQAEIQQQIALQAMVRGGPGEQGRPSPPRRAPTQEQGA